MNRLIVPAGMSRRHFLGHMAQSTVLAGSAMSFVNTLRANAADLESRRKAAILLWMGGGPSTMDIWDLKPGASTGGPFSPISTSVAGIQISEHMPMMARNVQHLAIIRSMSTREADHQRGRYYMHTGYVPNPNLEHPSLGAVLSRELAEDRTDLQIPAFFSIGGASEGPGFLGMAHAPFVVDSNGRVRNLNPSKEFSERLPLRLQMLEALEQNFIDENRGEGAREHLKVLQKTVNLMTSPQMSALRVNDEPADVRERYGTSGFARGCLMARRLVEVGVPFVEVDLGGWDNHANIFPTLQNDRLPTLDRAMSALFEDLETRGLLADTAVIWMGEFSRTPRINGNAGRDHWARSWSVVVGGAGMAGGQAIGQTSSDGTEVTSDPYTSQDVMASVCKALGISLTTTYTTRSGRPMKIANSGRVIKELFS
jgi:uncharacterized protein (DUF1501 family)